MLSAARSMAGTKSPETFSGAESPEALAKQRLFNEVSRSHASLIARICLSFADSRDDFEDMRQDALLNIWRGLDNFKAQSALSTWIYRVTLNSCVSHHNKSTRRAAVSMRDLYAELYDNSSHEQMERYRLMYELIGKLRPIDKSIILMWLDSKTYDEIADVTGISHAAVATRIKRAKDTLRKLYKQNNGN